MAKQDPHHSSLTRAEQWLARFAFHPFVIAYALFFLFIALAWSALLAMPSALDSAFLASESDRSDWLHLYLNWLRAGIAAICGPMGEPNLVNIYARNLFMWSLMVCAMMLPSFTPTLLMYSDIAAAAKHKSKHVVSPGWLAAGYGLAWLVTCLAFAAVQTGLYRAGFLDQTDQVSAPLIVAMALIAAGAYQFSPLKLACLKKCQQPFVTLFGQWRSDVAGVLRLGIRQGIYCIGCCWALMLLMLVFGMTNFFWMAFCGALMTLEKTGISGRLRSAIGGGLLLCGVIFAIVTNVSTTLHLSSG